ncbi:hypothetical protein P3T76_009748 [Phytophthora citrophthora]|uniref:Uncharacterized protein n=1 Tax=Phytophthora citrophthora TaxID=4793 RepID=A0AAD9GEG4_9STRA|nr:hypothetical protein P3T76_009748 [Phytophthora citrophthora]
MHLVQEEWQRTSNTLQSFALLMLKRFCYLKTGDPFKSDFRFWNGTLSAGDTHELARVGVLSRKRLCGTLKYPGLRGPQSGINVEMASCTHPAEGRPVELLSHGQTPRNMNIGQGVRRLRAPIA